MVYIADNSRHKRPLWEMLILIAFFVGIALLCRIPPELGKHRVVAGPAAPQIETTQTQHSSDE